MVLEDSDKVSASSARKNPLIMVARKGVFGFAGAHSFA